MRREIGVLVYFIVPRDRYSDGRILFPIERTKGIRGSLYRVLLGTESFTLSFVSTVQVYCPVFTSTNHRVGTFVQRIDLQTRSEPALPTH
jgi:hypothetical protein